jgi:DNA repair protein RadA/Sms
MKSPLLQCSHCQAQYPKWQGRCLECGKWGTIAESEGENKDGTTAKSVKPLNLSEIKNTEVRINSKIAEIDRVLGGGIVSGSLILLGGDPGIGKTTLAMQLAGNLSSILYASGEESAEQINNRADRLNLDKSKLHFLQENNIEIIIATALELKPQLLIIDSIQTVYLDTATGSPGSVSQITACASKLMELAKKNNITVLIIGHVTKDGVVAGPKTLEHLVDTVMYLENDSQNYFKLLRTIKNRFGSTGEIGVFEMTGTGLKEILNPGAVFFEKNPAENSAGIAVGAVLEGSRVFIVEIQALVAKSFFGYPVRKASGFDLNRLQMLLAVISKYGKINLSSADVYLNLVGGLKTKDPGADLTVALAILSAFLEKPLPPAVLAIGEIGLSGEIRPVPQLEKRLKEGEKIGFKTFLIPSSKEKIAGTTIKNISELLEWLKNNN